MRNVRAAVAAITSLLLIGAVSSLGTASAATTGVGTSDVTTTIVGVALGTDGSVLGVELLGDNARSTIDPAVSAPSAFSKLTAVDVSSKAVAALNKTSGAVESKQPGGDDSVTTGSVDLSEPVTGVSIPDSVLSGTLGAASLSSAVANGSATSALDAALTNAAIAGGLATVQGVSSKVATTAGPTQSTGARTVKIDQVVVLDLGSLLAGLKISLADLPLDVLVGLLEELGVSIEGFDAVSEINATVDALQVQLDELVTAGSALPVGETVETIVDTVNSTPLGTIISAPTEDAIEALPDPAAMVDELIDQVQGAITEIVEDVLAALDSVALLEVTGLEVGVNTKAADTVQNSAAGVTAKIGGLKVGGTAIQGIDIAQALADINAVVKTVTDTIGDALVEVHPDLEDVVTVKVFERAADHGVAVSEGYVEAVDGITALSATVTPPAALADILADIAGATETVEDLLDSVDGQAVLDDLDVEMVDLTTQLNASSAGALGGGGTVVVGSLGSTSNFTPSNGLPGPGGGPGNGTGTGTEQNRRLAATGADGTVPLTGLALLLIALGLGFREWVRMPARRAAR